MNVLSRPLVAVVGSLLVVLGALPAMGQRFMPNDIVQAENITEAMNDRIVALVDPPVFDMGQDDVDPEELKAAREQLQGFFRSGQPTAAYLEALSTAISGRIGTAVDHDSPLVRMNAMIILGLMVDDGSKALIDKGLKDDNAAVQHWAMIALGKRVKWWQKQLAETGARNLQAKIDAAVAQIKKLLTAESPPHPIVVGAGLDALVNINTPLSREALIDSLNQRVALHAADPDLAYTAERSAIERFTGILIGENPPDIRSIRGFSRAMARYSALIVNQAQANQIDPEREQGSHAMLFLCLQGMAQVCATAKAQPPANYIQAREWIKNGRWAELKELVEKDWGQILIAEPFNLQPSQLAVNPTP